MDSLQRILYDDDNGMLEKSSNQIMIISVVFKVVRSDCKQFFFRPEKT
jgi:hypothetical protein